MGLQKGNSKLGSHIMITFQFSTLPSNSTLFQSIYKPFSLIIVYCVTNRFVCWRQSRKRDISDDVDKKKTFQIKLESYQEDISRFFDVVHMEFGMIIRK